MQIPLSVYISSKNVFHVHGIDATENVVARKQLPLRHWGGCGSVCVGGGWVGWGVGLFGGFGGGEGCLCGGVITFLRHCPPCLIGI